MLLNNSDGTFAYPAIFSSTETPPSRSRRSFWQSGSGGHPRRVRWLTLWGIMAAVESCFVVARPFCMRSPAADLNPVVFKGLDREIAFREQLHVVKEFAARNCAHSRLLDRRRAGAAKADVEIGGGELQDIARGLQQDMGKDRDRGPAVNGALNLGQLLEQVLPAHHKLRRFVCG